MSPATVGGQHQKSRPETGNSATERSSSKVSASCLPSGPSELGFPGSRCATDSKTVGMLSGRSLLLPSESDNDPQGEPSKPICIDLFTGLHGWAKGFLAEGYRVIGFDLHDMCAETGHPRQDGDFQLVLQDALTIHGSQFRRADVIVASPPCFVADTLILTARGLVQIPEVMVGDLVLTHRKRWRRVLKTGSTVAPTVIASGYGGQLEGTAEHPVYARQNEGGFSVWGKQQKAPVNIPKRLGESEWIPLASMGGCHWASPVAFDPLPIPELPNSLTGVPEFWWIVGRWVGDGWVRLREETDRGDSVIICCGHSEADELEARLNAFSARSGRRAKAGELHWHRSSERTATRFTAASNSFAQWLTVHFGRGAAMKSWPAWALGMDESSRTALLAGYVSADGSKGRNGALEVTRATTVSKRLAIGTRLLAASLGTTSNLHFTSRPTTCRIEGRVVRQRDTWTATWTPGSGSNRLVENQDGFLWGVVRNVSPAQEAARVWNLEVDEDNSYTAEGIVVHNCQEYSYMAMPWSRAKKIAAEYRDGTRDVADLTRLFDACFRIQREACEAAGRHIPMVVENVRGAQPWVGRAKARYGSFYFWGDVPALMPSAHGAPQKFHPDGTQHGQGSWFAIADSKNRGGRKVPGMNFHEHEKTGKPGRSFQSAAVKQAIAGAGETYGGDFGWDGSAMRTGSSKSPARKAASAQIAMIPFELARWIARVYKPAELERFVDEA